VAIDLYFHHNTRRIRMHKTHFSGAILAIFLALILGALNVVPVFADESAPPEVVSSEQVDEVKEPEETEEGATLLAAEGSDLGSESESPSVAEVIESLPEETGLIVLDEDGEALPLASEAAAEVFKDGDPQWCPVGVTPGSVSCSPAFNYFTGAGGLIEWLLANQSSVAKAGVIWVAAGYDANLEQDSIIEIDGSLFAQNGASMDDFALTINGGWAGGTSKAMNPNTPSVLKLPLNIINWTGAITINNIVIEGASGIGETALWIETKGNIVLNYVDVQNTTTDGGAYLDNQGGTGTVTVNDSTFNNNNGDGLNIFSKNTVTIKNIVAIGNTGYGVYVIVDDGTGKRAVNVNGTNYFFNNGKDGLYIGAYVPVTTSLLVGTEKMVQQ
jgi:hypothetical protein